MTDKKREIIFMLILIFGTLLITFTCTFGVFELVRICNPLSTSTSTIINSLIGSSLVSFIWTFILGYFLIINYKRDNKNDD